jgi:hypothetical protein
VLIVIGKQDIQVDWQADGAVFEALAAQRSNISIVAVGATEIETSPTLVIRLGERLREARLNARLTAHKAAERAGLRAHGPLVLYENGKLLPSLDQLAALAQSYAVPLVAMLERATVPQISAFARLLQRG